jgi:valyl-tRNA synthetase
MQDVPFRKVYIHGLIRDGQGQKMSKSKGNVLDPIDLIDGIDLESLVAKRTSGLRQPQMAPAIEKLTRREFPEGIPAFGCDALRFTFAALATTGRDIRFDLGRIEGYRNFCNKLWNAARYVLMQTEGHSISQPAALSVADRWILSRANRMLTEVHKHIEDYRLDLASQALYEFIWNEYCDWYLELSKPSLQQDEESFQNATRHTLLSVLEVSLRALHPLMPFITEEIWQRVKTPLGIEGDSIMIQPFPESGPGDEQAEQDINWLKLVLQGIRQIRSELNLAPSLKLEVELQAGNESDRNRFAQFESLLASLGRISSFRWVDDQAETSNSAVALVGGLKVLIPLAGLVDVNAELARIEKLMARESADLKRSEGKMNNKKFVENAPAQVVEQEKGRLAAHQAKLEQLSLQLEQLERLRN